MLSRTILFVAILTICLSDQVVTQGTSTNTSHQNSLEKNLVGRQLQGNWHTNDNTALSFLSYFESKTGYSLTIFHQDRQFDPDGSLGYVGNVTIQLLDPKYVNGKAIYIELNLTSKFDAKKQMWAGVVPGEIYILYERIVVGRYPIELNYTITERILNLKSLLFDIEVEQLKGPRHWKTPFIMILPNLLFLFLMRKSLLQQIQAPQRIAGVSVTFVMSFLFMIGFAQLYLALNQSAWYLLTSISTFLSFSLYGFYAFTYQKILSESRGIQYFLVSTFYTILLMFNYNNQWVLLVNGLWLLPQIGLNAWNGNKTKFHPWLIGVMVYNQIYSIYVLGCSDNVFMLKPKYWTCMFLLTSLALQISIIHLQSILGGRFFIPNFLIPNYHEYIVKLKIGSEKGVQNCPICLNKIQDLPSTDMMVNMDQTTMDIRTRDGEIYAMVTPCHHYFHVVCLEKCMEVNMRCPVDREPLPPLD